MFIHWGRVMHRCVGNLTIVASDNDLTTGRCPAIISTNAGILMIRSLGTNFSEILMEIHTFPFNKTHLKISSAKWWPCCLGLNVLMHGGLNCMKWLHHWRKVSGIFPFRSKGAGSAINPWIFIVLYFLMYQETIKTVFILSYLYECSHSHMLRIFCKLCIL